MTDSSLSPNKPEMLRFMEAITQDWKLWNSTPLLEIRLIDEGESPEVKQFSPSNLDHAVEYVTALNPNGYNAYLMVNPVPGDIYLGAGATDADIPAAFYCFADGDEGKSAENILSFKTPPPDIVVTTGTVPSKRVHGYWKFDEPCFDLKAWKSLQQAIAYKFKSDRRVVNPSRIMRIAGSISWPSKTKIARGYIPELTRFQFTKGETK